MSVGFADRVVVITGAGRGLGRVYALEIARRGGVVVANDIGVEQTPEGTVACANTVVDEIRDLGGAATPSHVSIADRHGCTELIEGTLDTHGRIDVLIHSAGNLRNAPFEEMTGADLNAVIATHLFGAFDLCQLAFPTMRRRGYGRIVLTSSASGLFGRPRGTNYAMAKAGLVGLCNSLAIEGEHHGILANLVMPVASTRMAPLPAPDDTTLVAEMLRRLAADPRCAPDWVAPLVVLLASERWTRSKRIYSAVGGRYAEVVIGVADGWHAGGDRAPTPEEIHDHLDDIDLGAVDAMSRPRTTVDEVMAALGDVGWASATTSTR